jgi:Tfp pilus assembly protein PilN
MRAVNLLPQNAYAPRQRLPHAPVVLAATAPILAGALVYLGYSLEHAKVTDRQDSLALVRSQIDALRPAPVLTAATAGAAAQLASRQAALAGVLAQQVPWDVVFDQIARVLPADAWLTTLSAASPTPVASAAASSPTAFSIQGYTYSQAAVAHVLTRLALVPSLADVALSSTTATAAGGKQLVQFSITASIAGAS